MTWNKCKK